MSIKAIFFDLDDTLHDHLFPFSEAVNFTFPDLCYQVNTLSLYKRFRDFSDILWKSYSNHELTLKELRINRIILAFESFNKEIPIELATEFQRQYELRLNKLQLFVEVPELLEVLKDKGYKMGIITNGPVDHQFNKIRSLGLTEAIPRELIFISDEVGIAKPNPQLFKHVSQKVDILPSELLYIGDSWQNDIVAPIKAGWKSVWFNHRRRLPDTDDRALAEIHQLPSLVHLLSNIN